MELLIKMFYILFYILFFVWLFLRIRNVVLIKKLNYKESYNSLKKEFKDKKISKNLFRIIIAGIIIFSTYLTIGLVTGALALFMTFITLGGIAYREAGVDSTFYDNLMSFVTNYFSLVNYIACYIYLIGNIVLIRSIYINILINKKLKSN